MSVVYILTHIMCNSRQLGHVAFIGKMGVDINNLHRWTDYITLKIFAYTWGSVRCIHILECIVYRGSHGARNMSFG
jgi:hypothetical protein